MLLTLLGPSHRSRHEGQAEDQAALRTRKVLIGAVLLFDHRGVMSVFKVVGSHGPNLSMIRDESPESRRKQ